MYLKGKIYLLTLRICSQLKTNRNFQEESKQSFCELDAKHFALGDCFSLFLAYSIRGRDGFIQPIFYPFFFLSASVCKSDKMG